MKGRKQRTLLAILLVFALVLGMPGQGFAAYATDDGVDEIAAETPVPEVPEPPPGPTPAEIAKAEADAAAAKKAAEKAVLEQKIAGINEQLAGQKTQEEEIKKKLSAARGNVAEAEAVVNNLGMQISNTQYQINLMEEKIYLLGLDITEKETSISEKQAEYDKNYDIFIARFRTMSMHSNTSNIGLILGADSYIDFLTTTDTINRIAEHDKNMMAELSVEKTALEAEMDVLEDSKGELQTTHSTTAVQKQNLAVQQGEAIGKVQDFANLEQQFESELAASQAKSQQMAAEINNIYKQIKMSENPYVGGAMAWPAPSAGQISSYFGWRFGGSDYHTGIDLTGGGVLGTPVVAANDGEVVFVNWSHTPGYSYGMYVIVDHGGNTSTLYAHLSNINVVNGEKVTRGQTIGAVGTTGWSTGPHLHFEVRINGSPQNPQPYITAG